TLKLWIPSPSFTTLNVNVPAGRFENFESLKPSSDGIPIATPTTVTFALACALTCPDAAPATTKPQAARPTLATRREPETRPLRCISTEAPFGVDPCGANRPQAGEL